MEKITNFFIHFWLAVTVASLIYALYMIYLQGWEEGYRNLFIPFIAFFWYLFRRNMHKRMQKNLQQGEKK
ncbi:MAG: hypothetical protein IT223_08915 [Crocinitomicaceae bacterium]|nr:hypothetical protein [Crocinitomicaceae bacterium]